MKKYKAHFSIWNCLSETQAEISKLQLMFKGLSATLAGMTWYATDMQFAVYVAIGGFAIDFLLSCVWLEEVK